MQIFINLFKHRHLQLLTKLPLASKLKQKGLHVSVMGKICSQVKPTFPLTTIRVNGTKKFPKRVNGTKTFLKRVKGTRKFTDQTRVNTGLT